MLQTKFLILLETKVPCRNQLRSIYIVRENNFTEYHLLLTNYYYMSTAPSWAASSIGLVRVQSWQACMIFFKLSCPIFNCDDLRIYLLIQ